MPVIMMFFILQ